MKINFYDCMQYLTSEDLEMKSIEFLTKSLKIKTEKLSHELCEKNAIIRAARKINLAKIKDDALEALLE